MIGHVIKIALGIGLLEVDRGRQRLIAQRQHTDAGLSVLALRDQTRSEEHTSELQSRLHLVCRLLLEKKIWSFACARPTPRSPGRRFRPPWHWIRATGKFWLPWTRILILKTPTRSTGPSAFACSRTATSKSPRISSPGWIRRRRLQARPTPRRDFHRLPAVRRS